MMNVWLAILVILLVLVTYAILFKLHANQRRLKGAIEEEATIRKAQNWKLYHFFKSNFLALMGKKAPVEEKIEKDENEPEHFDDLIREGEK
jgi:hypothetical protein